jgi:hypothetical protein
MGLIFLVLLKINVDFDLMVIRSDTQDSGLEKRVKGDPEEAQSERLEWKSTGKINRAFFYYEKCHRVHKKKYLSNNNKFKFFL